MRKYKLVNGFGYFKLKEGEVYDENYSPQKGFDTVKLSVKRYPRDWVEIIPPTPVEKVVELYNSLSDEVKEQFKKLINV